jgi:O-antigen ligase
MSSHNPLAMGSPNRSEDKNWNWLVLGFAILSMFVGAAIAYLVGETGLLSLLITSIIILIIIAVLYPELALFGLLLVVYINLSDVLINYHGLPSIARPIVGVVFGIILIRAAAFKDRFHGWKSFVFLVVLYGLAGIIPMLIAADYDGVSLSLQDYLKDVFIGLEVILLIRTPTNLRHAVWILLLAGLLMGGLTFYQQITNTLEDPYWGFAKSLRDTISGLRISGPIGDPNTYAQIMAVLIPLALERVLNEKRPLLRVLALVIVFLCGFAVVFTYSRGGFLAVMFSLLFLAIRRPPRPAVAAGMLGILLLIFQFLPETYTNRLSTLFYFLPNNKESALRDRSFQGRTSENLVATMMFEDHPLIGVGAGNFNANYQDYARRLGLDPRRDARSAHSLYLEVASERGLLGLTMFFAIVGASYWSLWHAEKRYLRLGMKDFADLSVALSSGLTAYLAAALFLHDSYIRYFWVLIGIAWAAASIAEQTYRSARQSRALQP